MFKQTLTAILMASLMAGSAVAASKDAARSYKDAKRYLSNCKNNDITIPVGKLGFREVERYWETVPELKKAREDFLEANEKMSSILKRDPEYRDALAEFDRKDQTEKQRQTNWNKAKSSVFRRMAGDSDYRRARQKREEALFECNLVTFEYILQDYKKQEKPFPIEQFTS